MNIRTDSTEYIYSTITADHDLTGKTIDVAFPLANDAPATWYPAEVTGVQQTVTAPNPERWTATYRILVGPNGGATTLGVGNYDWTVRLNDTAERPVRKSGSVIVTLT